MKCILWNADYICALIVKFVSDSSGHKVLITLKKNLLNDGRIAIAWGDIHCDRYLSIVYKAGCSCTIGESTARCKYLLSNRPCTIRYKCRHTCKTHSMLFEWKVTCKEELALCVNNCKIYIWATRKVKHNTGLESTDQLNTDSETWCRTNHWSQGNPCWLHQWWIHIT